MAIKNLGHYEGIVEDININSIQFQSLDPTHKKLIKLNNERQRLSSRLESIEQQMDSIKSSIKFKASIGKLPWAWIWIKRSTRVKWKEEFIKFCGQQQAEKVTQQYKTQEYPQIGIQFIDPIPDSIKQVKANPAKFPLIKHKLKKT